MTLYTVHAPRPAGGDAAAADPADLVFVKDGFCWPALFVPIVWLVWRGLWLALLLYLVLAVGLAVLSGLGGSDISTAVMVLFSIWFALEANGLRRWTLERRRHVLVGVVEGRNVEEAERRYFAGVAEDTPAPGPAPATPGPAPLVAAEPPPPPAPPMPPPLPPRRDPGIVGLFPTPRPGR
jgi:hypothetical protein